MRRNGDTGRWEVANGMYVYKDGLRGEGEERIKES